MRSSHNLIKLAIILLLVIAVYVDYSYNQKPQETTVPEQTATVVTQKVDNKQLQCLADNIYYEAGGEPLEGKAAVARVVLNRVNHGGFAATPCKVVYQTNTVKQTNEDDETFWVKVCQFSWVCEGKGNPNRNTHRYQSSLQVAKDVLLYDKYKDILPKTVLFFHNTSVTNHWPHKVVAKIGNHIFYEKKPKKHVKKQSNRHSSVAQQGRVQSQDV